MHTRQCKGRCCTYRWACRWTALVGGLHRAACLPPCHAAAPAPGERRHILQSPAVGPAPAKAPNCLGWRGHWLRVSQECCSLVNDPTKVLLSGQ